jgi:tight adherence protein B
LLAGLVLGIAVFGILSGGILLLSSNQGRVRTRLQQFVATTDAPGAALVADLRAEKRADLFAQVDARLAGRASTQVLRARLERAGLTLTPGEFTLMRAGTAVLTGVIAIALVPQWWWLALPVGLAVGTSLPALYLRRALSGRMSKLDQQLPDLLNVLAGSVRTGSSLFQALDRVAREAPEPSAAEYGRVVRALSLGASLDETLRNLAARIPTEDIDMLTTAISIQQQTGGNLAQTLDLIATTVRERHRVQREIQVLSAQQRISAYVLAGLPILLTGLLFLISPNYIGRLFEPGIMLMLPCSVVVLLVVGFLMMNSMAAIDV